MIKIDYDVVVELTRAGWPARRIADKLDCTARQVARIRAFRDVQVRPPVPKFAEDEKRWAEALFDDGCSLFEVARTLGRDPSTIRRHCPGRAWTSAQHGEFMRILRGSRVEL